MKINTTIQIALRALRQNVMRAALTILGIVIGIAAVIAMVEIGAGSSKAIKQTIQSMGANNLLIQPGVAASGGVSFGAGSSNTLTIEDAEAVAREVPQVKNSAPIVRMRTQLVSGNRNWIPQYIYGTTPSFLVVRDWEGLSEGEMFTERDVKNGTAVCVVGQTLVRELFEGASPLGKEVRVENVPFRVIGVLRPKGANMMGMDQDDIFLAPWTTIRSRVARSSSGSSPAPAPATAEAPASGTLAELYPGAGAQFYPGSAGTQASFVKQPVTIDQLLVSIRSSPEIQSAIAEITTLFRTRHKLEGADPDDFNIRDMSEMTKAATTTSTVMRNLLLCVALISLVVGGVGIMNIMLVSVTERTREVGLRMAIGARESDIRRQFLVEAVVLCLMGGIVGVVVGRLASIAVTYALKWPVESSITAIVGAIGVSTAVGVIFGYYPAWKASRQNPIDALRYE